MSTATVWQLPTAVGQGAPLGSPEDAGVPGRSPSDRRSHLRLVPTDPRGRQARGARPARHAGGLAITRRGRLAVTLVVTVAAVALAVALWTAGTPTGPTIDHATTVSSGQTLSQIATEQMPGVPVHEAVIQIQLVNDLSSSDVHAGQSLLIPAMP